MSSLVLLRSTTSPKKPISVGPEYGHAEESRHVKHWFDAMLAHILTECVYSLQCIQARKSPTVDGKVERNSDGKEIRFPVILTFREKEIARRIVLGFKQWVCGFDILRVQEGHSLVSYVCGELRLPDLRRLIGRTSSSHCHCSSFLTY